MQVQKQLSKKKGDKVYHKYVVVLKNDLVEKAQFKEGDELEGEAKKGEIKLRKKVI